MMSQLQNLPQDAVFWGEGALARALVKLNEYGIGYPIILSVGPLDEMRRGFVEPYIRDSVDVFLDLPAHAPDVGIRKALTAALAAGAESIVAHGGGSVLDAAKAVSYLHKKAKGHYLPIVALPTTLSGSEFSHYFGITETDSPQKFKQSYAIRETVPRVVILDPNLLLYTPRALLLSSAIKAIDHAVEGMRQVDIDHPHAVMAARGVARFLTVLAQWPRQVETNEALDSNQVDLNDLQALQLASWYCYFSPASVIYGLSHRIGHILGGTYGLPHSATSCITLAPVIRACGSFYKGRLGAFSGEAGGDPTGERLADRIAALVKALGLPDRMRSYGLQESQIGEIAALLKDKYPVEVADLGEDAEARLDGLLESLW
jgi:maleylacetate reductase